MHKLTIIAGPNRGATFAVQEGETSVGRQTGNGIVLSSSKVSKRHCTITAGADGIVITDQGSSNGTFVNGSLVKQRALKPGDRISVGDFVLELTKPSPRLAKAAPVAGIGGNVQFANAGPPGDVMQGNQSTPVFSSTGAVTNAAPMPTDLKGRALHFFEKIVMPPFFGANLKHEWRILMVGLFAALVIGNLVISVYPLMDANRAQVVSETKRRAIFMAKQIVERNSAAIAAGAETKTDIGQLDKEDGVRIAVLTDLDNRILAPGAKMNTYLVSGSEAAFATRMRDDFRKGLESGRAIELDSATVAAVEPLKVLNPQLGKNVVVGMAVVSLDSSLSTPDIGEMGVIYAETLILTGLLGALILMIMYRLTLKPLEVLNDDIDKVLKGEMNQVTREFKFGETGQLWDVINSALQRLPKGGAAGDMGGVSAPQANVLDDVSGAIRMIGDIAKFGMIVCDGDRKITYINPMFEEMTGIRSENAVGQDIPGVARDQSFGAFANDVFDRAVPGGAAVSEDYDFSGTAYRMQITALGAPDGSAKGFVMVAVKAEG